MDNDAMDVLQWGLNFFGKIFKALACLLLMEILLVIWFVVTCISKRAGMGVWSFMDKVHDKLGFDK